MTNLTIQRTGEFAVITYGTTHCGTKSPLKVRYQFIARCSASDLDERGFLFDQTRVDAFMQAQTSTRLSCETFAISLARELFKQIRSENGKCNPQYLSLRLSPEPFAAELTFEWAAEPAKPTRRKKAA